MAAYEYTHACLQWLNVQSSNFSQVTSDSLEKPVAARFL